MSTASSTHKPVIHDRRSVSGATEPETDCRGCPSIGGEFCSQLTHGPDGCQPKIRKRETAARSRQILYRSGETPREIGIIREGIAFQYVLVPDGRRQILSFCLPGDFLSTSLVTKGSMHFSIQALTPMRLCLFDREAVVAFIRDNPDRATAFTRICMREKERLEARIVDLGRRTAEERISRFIIDLMRRLEQHGHEGPRLPFPMKQKHIADALGLTQVHVSRVIGRLRAAGLIEVSGGAIEIFDLRGLREIAGERRG